MKSSELLAPFDRLADAFGLDGSARALVATIAARSGWGDRTSTAPLLPCGFRHGVPWGLSVVVGAGAPEVRVLVEAQSDPPIAAGYARAAAQVTDLFEECGASIASLRPALAKIAPGALPYVRVWHGVAFRPAAEPAYRVYLCVPSEHRTLAAARRFLIDDVCDTDVLATVLRDEDAITIVSLDLVEGRGARAKVYALVPDASIARVEALYDLGEESCPGDVARFARAMLGGDGSIWWLVCFVFIGGEIKRVALHFGVPRHIPDDADAGVRLRSLFDELGLDPGPYARSIEALGPASARHHFVSFQRIGKDPRVTVYFLPDGAVRG